MQFPAFFTIHEIRVTPPLKMKRSPFFFFFSEIINCDLEMFFTINSGSQKWSLRTMNVCVCIISMTITAYITTYTICSKGECIFFFFELNHQIFFFFHAACYDEEAICRNKTSSLSMGKHRL